MTNTFIESLITGGALSVLLAHTLKTKFVKIEIYLLVWIVFTIRLSKTPYNTGSRPCAYKFLDTTRMWASCWISSALAIPNWTWELRENFWIKAFWMEKNHKHFFVDIGFTKLFFRHFGNYWLLVFGYNKSFKFLISKTPALLKTLLSCSKSQLCMVCKVWQYWRLQSTSLTFKFDSHVHSIKESLHDLHTSM